MEILLACLSALSYDSVSCKRECCVAEWQGLHVKHISYVAGLTRQPLQLAMGYSEAQHR